MVDVKSIGQQVRDNVVADLLGKAVVGLLLLAIGAVIVAMRSNASMPIWAFAAALALAVAIVFLLVEARTKSENLAWFAVEMQEQYLQHLAHTLHTLQNVLTDGVDRRAIGDYLTHGILAPARDMLIRHPDDQVRLSILSPEDDAFRMDFWAGHDLTSAKKFTIPIKDSISRVAFESGTTETWDDVHDDDRYAEHPKATRTTRAMVSVPLTHGSEVIGVFNAISDQPRGFNPADRLYIECLGSVIDVAVGILRAGHLVDTTD